MHYITVMHHTHTTSQDVKLISPPNTITSNFLEVTLSVCDNIFNTTVSIPSTFARRLYSPTLFDELIQYLIVTKV
jgi:hypothetical protein